MILDIDNPKAVEITSNLFLQGAIIVYPTDTVYGLGTIATSEYDEKIKKIFMIKKRPLNKPLSILITKNMINEYIDAPDHVISKLKDIWPASVTFILKMKESKKETLSSLLNPSKNLTIACRVPPHRFLQSVLREINYPIVGTSANISGISASSNFTHVKNNLGESDIDLWVFQKNNLNNLSSTLIDLTDYRKPLVLRKGDYDFKKNWRPL
ncbi:MAG: L-threonylcarbamoyladenylate synthase [Candidatus Hodarchaeales archaeon]